MSRWHRRHPIEKLCCGAAWMSVALLLPPWPAELIVAASVTGIALALAGVRPRTWLALYSAPVAFAAFAAIPLWWNLGFDAWNSQAYSAPLRSAGCSAVLLLLGLTTPMEEWLALASRARVPGFVIDLAYLIHRFITEAVSDMAAMQRMLDVRARDRRWRFRLDGAAKLASSLFRRVLALAGRVERGLAARGVERQIVPVGTPASFSLVSAMRLAAVPLALLAGGLL